MATNITQEQNEKKQNVIYETVVINSTTINIYQYSHCPEKYFSSLLELFKEELTEPYCYFLLQYFFQKFGEITLIATVDGSDSKCVGAIVSKVDRNRNEYGDLYYEGYISMLAVRRNFQGLGIGSYLIKEGIKLMQQYYQVKIVSLDANVTSLQALRFYEKHGFTRTKRKYRYYIGGDDAFELIKMVE